jgi:hypothetical protein
MWFLFSRTSDTYLNVGNSIFLHTNFDHILIIHFTVHYISTTNRIGIVMVSVLASCKIDRGFEHWSAPTKDNYNISFFKTFISYETCEHFLLFCFLITEMIFFTNSQFNRNILFLVNLVFRAYIPTKFDLCQQLRQYVQ